MKYCYCIELLNEMFFCVILLLMEIIKCVLSVMPFSVSTVSTKNKTKYPGFLSNLPFFIPLYPQNYKQPSPEPHKYSVLHNLKKLTQTKIKKAVKLKQNNNLEWLLPPQIKISNKQILHEDVCRCN